MKLCIPTKDDRGPEAEPFGHFGSAPFFTLVDTDTGEIEVVANTNLHHRHGTCHPLSQLRGRGLDAIVCRGLGRRAFTSLASEGIDVMVASEGNVADILAAFEAGVLRPLTEEEACHGRHEHRHEHHHRHHHARWRGGEDDRGE